MALSDGAGALQEEEGRGTFSSCLDCADGWGNLARICPCPVAVEFEWTFEGITSYGAQRIGRETEWERD